MSSECNCGVGLQVKASLDCNSYVRYASPVHKYLRKHTDDGTTRKTQDIKSTPVGFMYKTHLKQHEWSQSVIKS